MLGTGAAEVVAVTDSSRQPADAALADLLGGQVSMMFGNWPEFRGHVQSGKLRALAVAGSQRSPALPDVPTLAEAGLDLEPEATGSDETDPSGSDEPA